MMHAIRNSLAGLAFALAAGLAGPIAAAGETVPVLTLPMAERVIEAGIAAARRLGAPGGALAVVDAGGAPLAVARLEGSFPASGTIALGKARTAAIFQRPSAVLEKAINEGRAAILALVGTVDATPMQGGVPISIDGHVVGAIGVAGAASAAQDTEIAEAAAQAAADPAALGAAGLTHVSEAEVTAAFAAGKPLVENAGFKVHASRREKPGEAEVHTIDTDILYVLEGEAVIVLGGKLIEPRSVTPTEIRGKSIEGRRGAAAQEGRRAGDSRGHAALVPRPAAAPRPLLRRQVHRSRAVTFRSTAILCAACALAAWMASPHPGWAQTSSEESAVPAGDVVRGKAAELDMTKEEDLALVAGEWRVQDATIVPVEFRREGADGQPGGEPSSTYDVSPQAGAADFDDSAWPVVPPAELERRRGGGRLSFVWYRLALTVPEAIAGEPVAGRDLVFSTAIDDAAEVWVDGELRRCPGQQGGAMVAGWNAENRVVAARGVRPGQRIRLAVFGINGPLSGSPTNYVWMRSARLAFVPGGGGPRAVAPACEENLAVERFDPRIDRILSRNPKLFLIGEGFTFTEGPVWDPADGGSLLVSDPNENRIYRWSEHAGLAVFRAPSGYAGADVGRYRQPGSNGLAIDARGRLAIDQHGNRRVVQLESDGSETVLADRYQGLRLNSPNDLVFRADGTLFFTDPFFGLPGFAADPAKELPHQGVYRVIDGHVELLAKELSGPNGLAFSPDEQLLYVGDWDERHKAVVRYPVLADGRLGRGETFVDLTGRPGEDAIDGVKTDELGNVYVSGPGGLWIVAPDGTILGLLRTPRHVHNLAWGEDGTVLYLAARDHLYRLPTGVRGHAPHLVPVPKIVCTRAELDRLIPRGAVPELVAAGHHWLEGPAWDPTTSELLYSDIPKNSIYAVQPGQRPRLVRAHAGYSGPLPFGGREPGSNGLAFDGEGRLLACQHGDRRVVRFDGDGSLTVVAESYQGRRLNSPNDVIALANGEVWFTDPPFGLPGWFDDPGKEIPFQGVYRVHRDGEVVLLTSEVRAPNGLALSPDHRTLYVSNAEPRINAVVYAFEVRPDATLGARRVFVDLTPESKAGAPGAPDGLEVDAYGNVWIAGPGGIHIYDAGAQLIGRIDFDRPAANLELAADSHLYVTAHTAIWRIPITAKPGRAP